MACLFLFENLVYMAIVGKQIETETKEKIKQFLVNSIPDTLVAEYFSFTVRNVGIVDQRLKVLKHKL